MADRLPRERSRRRRTNARARLRLEALEPRVLLSGWSGALTSDTLWKGTVEVTGNLSVDVGVTLTIEPGTIVKIHQATAITANGTVDARGTDATPIFFTSLNDDSVGDDLSGPGVATPQAGDWGAIYFNDMSDASFLDHVQVLYAGNLVAPGDAGGLVPSVSLDASGMAMADVTIAQPDSTADTLFVGNGSTLKVAGGSTLDVDGAIIVAGNSTILCQGADRSAQVGGVWAGEGMTIEADDMTVELGSAISANGQGYLGATTQFSMGAGPGAGEQGHNVSGGSGGAGYGGAGGTSQDGFVGGPTYGSATEPTDLGSGGSSDESGDWGGHGGGAIRLIVDGTLTLDGTVNANGNAGQGNEGSGGSGGSIWVTTDTLAGSGAFTANGGSADATYPGGGGGGRIAVEFSDTLTLPMANVDASGGTGYRSGSVGTVVFRGITPTTPYVTAIAPPDHTNDTTIQNISLTLSEPVAGDDARAAATYTFWPIRLKHTS